MKVLWQNRPDMNDFSAGDTVQINETRKQLLKLGVRVVIENSYDVDLKEFDLVHSFNTREIEHTYQYFKNARKYKKKFVLTPIIINLSEYNIDGRYGWDRILYKIITSENFFRTVKSFVLGKPQIHSGYRQHQCTVLEESCALCFLSRAEQNYVCSKYDVKGLQEVIYNGVDKVFYHACGDSFKQVYGLSDFVLIVGKIEPLKNQLQILRALKPLNIPLVFIGRPNMRHKIYYQKFLSELEAHTYIEHLDHEKLAGAYKAAKVHVLASWFDNAPLVNLEAGLAECNLVCTNRGFAKEYIQERAWFCDPNNQYSIRTAVEQAYKAPRSNILVEKIKNNYTWEKAALKIKQLYERLINSGTHL